MSSRDTTVLCSILQSKLPEIVTAAPTNLVIKPIATERTAEEQHREYQKGRVDGGRIVTYKDGYDSLSPHQRQPAHGERAVHAVDFGVFTQAGVYLTGAHYYEPLVARVRSLGLFSGASWRFQDLPHVQCRQVLD